ncbi:plasmid mobilization protein [Roseivivax sp. CAU 1761]
MTRDRQFKARMSASELEQLQELAHQHRMPTADLVRLVMLGPDVADRLPDRDILGGILRQLSGVSGNANQAVRALNTAAKSGDLAEDHLATVQEAIEAAAEVISAARLELRDQLSRLSG